MFIQAHLRLVVSHRNFAVTALLVKPSIIINKYYTLSKFVFCYSFSLFNPFTLNGTYLYDHFLMSF